MSRKSKFIRAKFWFQKILSKAKASLKDNKIRWLPIVLIIDLAKPKSGTTIFIYLLLFTLFIIILFIIIIIIIIIIISSGTWQQYYILGNY